MGDSNSYGSHDNKMCDTECEKLAGGEASGNGELSSQLCCSPAMRRHYCLAYTLVAASSHFRRMAAVGSRVASQADHTTPPTSIISAYASHKLRASHHPSDMYLVLPYARMLHGHRKIIRA